MPADPPAEEHDRQTVEETSDSDKRHDDGEEEESEETVCGPLPPHQTSEHHAGLPHHGHRRHRPQVDQRQHHRLPHASVQPRAAHADEQYGDGEKRGAGRHVYRAGRVETHPVVARQSRVPQSGDAPPICDLRVLEQDEENDARVVGRRDEQHEQDAADDVADDSVTRAVDHPVVRRAAVAEEP